MTDWEIIDRSDGSAWIRHNGKVIAMIWAGERLGRFVETEERAPYTVAGIIDHAADEEIPWRHLFQSTISCTRQVRLVDGYYESERHP